MDKVDFRKRLKHLYGPPAEFTLVEVPPMQFVKIDGKGDPNTAPGYAAAIQWLFSVSYALKFGSKKEGRDYTVPPPEALWFADDMSAFTRQARDQWRWTQMIMAPDWIKGAAFAAAVKVASAKLGRPPASLRLEKYDEGLSVQFLHVGSYAEEAPRIMQLHEEFLPANGLVANGMHHEIYLSDPRRVPAGKLKTIVRQPVRRLAAGRDKKAAR
ncbi:MAG TPA: GyrI-like domain-containing protein [Bauldia sp.]|nr:GyrI-like domain-containing protein [Bauldia sp.]